MWVGVGETDGENVPVGRLGDWVPVGVGGVGLPVRVGLKVESESECGLTLTVSEILVSVPRDRVAVGLPEGRLGVALAVRVGLLESLRE